MSRRVTLRSVVRSEWIKFCSVRSTLIGIGLTLALSIGLGIVGTIMLRGAWGTMDPVRRMVFSPIATSLVGVTFAQFAVGIVGSLLITNEYSSGSIRTTLTAVPSKARLVAGKLVVLTASVFAVGEIAAFVSFLLGQSMLAGVTPTASLSSGAVLRSVFFAGVYLTLLAALAFALGLLLRHSAATISVFVSVVLVVPLVIVIMPSGLQNAVTRFLPSEIGNSMMSATTPAHDFSALGSLGLLLVYVAVLLSVAIAVMSRRDA